MSSPTKSIIITITQLPNPQFSMYTLVVIPIAAIQLAMKKEQHYTRCHHLCTKSTLPPSNLIPHNPTVSQTWLTEVKDNHMHTLAVITVDIT